MPLLNEQTKTPWEPETPILATILTWMAIGLLVPTFIFAYQGNYAMMAACLVLAGLIIGVAQMVEKMHANSAKMLRAIEERRDR